MKYFTKSLKYSVYFILTVCLNLDQPTFQALGSHIWWLVITILANAALELGKSSEPLLLLSQPERKKHAENQHKREPKEGKVVILGSDPVSRTKWRRISSLFSPETSKAHFFLSKLRLSIFHIVTHCGLFSQWSIP